MPFADVVQTPTPGESHPILTVLVVFSVIAVTLLLLGLFQEHFESYGLSFSLRAFFVLVALFALSLIVIPALAKRYVQQRHEHGQISHAPDRPQFHAPH
jgi:hypothetical protein